MHQGLTKDILETRLQEDCPQVKTDVYSQPAKDEPLPKKPTRAQIIKDILHRQQQQPLAPEEHHYAETAGYLKCLKCGVNTHKRINEEAFQTFLASPCIDRAFPQPPHGHPSHSLWQKGGKVRCLQCGATWNLDSEQRIITNQLLTKVCKGASTKGSPPLSDFFKKKESSTSSSTQHGPTAPAATAAQPTPRRLNFQTALDAKEHEEEPTTSMSAEAMNPSPRADTGSDTQDDLPGFAVEFF